jgi:hypothetical protein
MHPRWPSGDATPRLGTPRPSIPRLGTLRLGTLRLRTSMRLAVLAAAVPLATAACGHASGGSAGTTVGHPGPTATQCGTARTPANVPVKIEVMRGQVTCPQAMTIEHHYANAIIHGKAPGVGGSGPVNVGGWRCQGFPTPKVLKTGWASECVRSGSEILAVLPPP